MWWTEISRTQNEWCKKKKKIMVGITMSKWRCADKNINVWSIPSTVGVNYYYRFWGLPHNNYCLLALCRTGRQSSTTDANPRDNSICPDVNARRNNNTIVILSLLPYRRRYRVSIAVNHNNILIRPIDGY